MTAVNAIPSPLTMPPGSFPVTPPVATQERLAKPHQLVLLHNTSEVQAHGIKDRYEQVVWLAPGEKKELDMVCDEISTLIHLSRTDRFFSIGAETRPSVSAASGENFGPAASPIATDRRSGNGAESEGGRARGARSRAG
jgi:hypothetical protein